MSTVRVGHSPHIAALMAHGPVIRLAYTRGAPGPGMCRARLPLGVAPCRSAIACPARGALRVDKRPNAFGRSGRSPWLGLKSDPNTRDAQPNGLEHAKGGRVLSDSGPVVTASKDKKRVTAAIMAAVGAYLQDEERARLAAAPEARPLPSISQWRAFGLWQTMRPRVAWRRRMF